MPRRHGLVRALRRRTRPGSRFREHAPDELAHYAKKAVDVEYRFPFGWKELEGIHNRGDLDLGRHQEASGENLEYFDPATEEHFMPWIVETSAGGGPRGVHVPDRRLSRGGGARREARRPRPSTRSLAPYKVAVLPLLKKRPEIVELCHAHPRRPGKRDMMAVYDDTAVDRQALPAPGRDRDAVVRDGRRRLARGRQGHRPRSRLDGADPSRPQPG